MPRNDPSRVSRRNLLASTLAVPLIGAAPERRSSRGTPEVSDLRDPLVAVAATWVVQRQTLEAMIFEWQRLEKQLIRRAKLTDVAIDKARGLKFPEAATMRALDSQMDGAYDVLESLASEAARLPAVSPEGALAKAALGLRVQGRYDWQPHALELLESGIADLRAFLAR